ncbi:MAG: amidohydrolase family protein [Pseudomonadales bacterium]
MRLRLYTRIRVIVLGLSLLLCLTTTAQGQSGSAGAPPQPGLYAFVNARLITMQSPAITAGNLIVDGARIVALGEVEVPPGAQVIDVAGGYIMPGLAEMHAHVPSPSQGQSYRDEVLFLWVAYGITTARGMLGHPDHLKLRDDLAAGRLWGPRLVTSGPSFNGRSVSSPEQARSMVREQHQLGYDFLKIHPGLTLAEYSAMAETAHEVGIAFAGHVPAEVGIDKALSVRQLTIDHLDGYLQGLVPDLALDDPAQRSFFGAALAGRADMSRLPALVEQTRQAGSWLVPTETLFINFAEADQLGALLRREDVAYLPPPLRERYVEALQGARDQVADAQRYLAVRQQMLMAMHEAGVGILLGSDSPQIFNVPGFSIHRELAAMVEAGMSPYEALATGTVKVAQFLGDADGGTLAVGKRADLVVVAGNPLKDIRHSREVQGVMVQGRWLNAATRATELARIRAQHSGQ